MLFKPLQMQFSGIVGCGCWVMSVLLRWLKCRKPYFLIGRCQQGERSSGATSRMRCRISRRVQRQQQMLNKHSRQLQRMPWVSSRKWRSLMMNSLIQSSWKMWTLPKIKPLPQGVAAVSKLLDCPCMLRFDRLEVLKRWCLVAQVLERSSWQATCCYP